MYLGDSDHTLDSKGRLIIPSRFREALGEKIIITRSLDPCLCIYDMEAWSSFCARLAELPSNDVNQRKLVRFFLAGAAEVEVDKQGRVLIPQKLRDSFGITREVMLAGVGSRIELWSKDAYYCNSMDSDELNTIAKDMLNGGFLI